MSCRKLTRSASSNVGRGTASREGGRSGTTSCYRCCSPSAQRVLKPGGKLCTAVWAQPDGNPWATIPMTAIATETELPATPPDAPGLFRCAAPGAIGDVLAAAGFRDVGETDVRASLTTTSAEEYWQYMTEVAAPVIAGLALVDEEARARIRSAAMKEAETFEVDGQLRLPLHARCIIGTR